MEERHKRLLIKQNPWWQKTREEIPEFERDLIKNLTEYEKYTQIIAVTGLRRVGKTVLMKQLIARILEKTQKENVCYISFDDVDFQKYEMAEELINYFLQYSNKSERRYLFLDEIQKLPNFADLLKTIYDTEKNLKIYVSGSSSLELKKHKETLAGRILTFHLPPLTFKEFVRYFRLKHEIDKDSLFREYELEFLPNKEEYKSLFDAYLQRGAFPELLDTEDEEYIKKYIKESIVEKTIADIAKTTGENEYTLHELFRLLANSNAQLFEMTNIANTLKISRNKVSEYISLLEKTFLIRIGYNYTISVPKQVRASKKQYIAHSSIVLAVLDYPLDTIKTKEVSGHLVEASIANHFEKISFWRTQQEEVDIIAQENGRITPIEVKYKNTITRDDIKGLIKFCEKFKTKEAVIITEDTLQEKEAQCNVILHIPAWLFLLIRQKHTHNQ